MCYNTKLMMHFILYTCIYIYKTNGFRTTSRTQCTFNHIYIPVYICIFVCKHIHACIYENEYTSVYKDSGIEKHAYASIPKRSFNYRKQIEEVSFMNLFFIITLVHSIYRCGSVMIIY